MLFMQITLKNANYEVVLNTFGAEINSFRSVKDGTQYVFEGPMSVWKFHAPVLFPHVGRIKDGFYTYAGKEYHLVNNGMSRDMEHKIIEQSATSATFELTESAETADKFPWKFSLKTHYELRDDGLTFTTTVTNTLETVTASVEKKWFNGETDITEQIQNASASVRLTDGTNPVTADADGNAFTAAESITVSDGVVTLTGTAWTYTWSNLPKYNASGTAIVYTVEETAAKVGDDNLTVSEVSETSGTLPEGFLIKNTLPTVDITATKVWQDKDGNVIQATAIPHEISEEVKVTFTLLADNEPTSHTVEVNGVDETADGAVPESADYEGADWTAYFKELPKYSDNGSLITYTVQETGKWPGFEAVDSDTAESGGTIINKQLTYNLKIVKVAKGTTTGLKGAKFQLTRKLDGEDSFTRFEHDQFEEVAGENGEAAKKNGPFEVKSTDGIILTGLLPGKYQIQETKAPDGYVITLSIFEFEIKTDGTIEPTTGDGTTLVQYLEARGTDPAGFQIENEPGVALPSTGGPGSNLLYLLGSLMLALGSAGLVMRKRRRVG